MPPDSNSSPIRRAELTLDGMHSAAFAPSVERARARQPGVVSARVIFPDERARVESAVSQLLRR